MAGLSRIPTRARWLLPPHLVATREHFRGCGVSEAVFTRLLLSDSPTVVMIVLVIVVAVIVREMLAVPMSPREAVFPVSGKGTLSP